MSPVSGTRSWRQEWERSLALLRALEGLPSPEVFEPISEKFRQEGEEKWSAWILANSSMPTHLNATGVEKAARLMRHGFALTMARMHIIWGYPLIALPAESYFVSLALGTPTDREGTRGTG